jgi:hypothetical protein
MEVYCLLCGFEHWCELTSEGDRRLLMYCERKEEERCYDR